MNGAASNDPSGPGQGRPSPPPGPPNPGWHLLPPVPPASPVGPPPAGEPHLGPPYPPARRPDAGPVVPGSPGRPVSVGGAVRLGRAGLAGARRHGWRLGGWTEVLLALPWLWWSWLAIQFLRLFSDTAYWALLGVWLVSAAAVLLPGTEQLLARRLWRLREPTAQEAQRIGPAWWAVCTAAGVDPGRFRVWISEGPDSAAPITPGSTVAVTSWAVLTLPPRHLEAVLAHELAHHLVLPARLSLLLAWLQLPARAAGRLVLAGLRHPVFSAPTKIVIGFFFVGVLLVWFFTSFSVYVVLMLSPFIAPWIVPAADRAAEHYADRVAASCGYGRLLAEVLAGREHQRAQAWASLPRTGRRSSQPLESRRLRRLERWLEQAPQHVHQPR